MRLQRRRFRIFQLTICCRVRKTIFEKNLTPASPGWRALSFPKRTFFQGSVSWNKVYTTKLISQFDAIVWVSVKTNCYERILRRVMLRKTVFWNFHSVFKILRKRSLYEKQCFQKVTTKDGVSFARRQKSQKLLSCREFLSTIYEYNTRVMGNNWLAGMGEP